MFAGAIFKGVVRDDRITFVTLWLRMATDVKHCQQSLFATAQDSQTYMCVSAELETDKILTFDGYME